MVHFPFPSCWFSAGSYPSSGSLGSSMRAAQGEGALLGTQICFPTEPHPGQTLGTHSLLGMEIAGNLYSTGQPWDCSSWSQAEDMGKQHLRSCLSKRRGKNGINNPVPAK